MTLRQKTDRSYWLVLLMIGVADLFIATWMVSSGLHLGAVGVGVIGAFVEGLAIGWFVGFHEGVEGQD